MKDVVIALDQGSGSSRALAFDAKGKVIARAQSPLKTAYPKPGWVEHDLQELAAGQEKALDAALSRLPSSLNVAALAIACQRSTIAVWDSATGQPLSTAISWQDGRAAALVAPYMDRQPRIHEATGLYLTPYYSAPKLRWILDNVPKAAQALAHGRLKAGPVATYLLWRWTKGKVFAVEPTLAQRTLLFNIRSQQWDGELLDLFKIPREILPEVRPSSHSFALIERKGRKIPVLAMLGDQQAAALGLGAEEVGTSVVNYGTGAFLLAQMGADQKRVPGLLTSVAWQKEGQPCQFFQEGTVHAAATSLHWLKDNLGLLKKVEEAEKLCRESTSRLLALPAIGGLGAPRWDYATQTAIHGLSSRTSRADVVRSFIEGLAFLISDIQSALESAGIAVTRLKASGGLSNMNYLLQFQSDLLQLPIERVVETEATACGAASLAAECAGLPWAPKLRSQASAAAFKPSIAAEKAQALKKSWTLFVEVQRKLSAELKRLGALN